MSRAHIYSHSRAHSPTFPSIHLRHNLFSNRSVASPTSQFILQPFRHFTYVKTHSPTLPSLNLRHSSFSNPSVASPTSQFIPQPSFVSPTSQALHLIHLASRPWYQLSNTFVIEASLLCFQPILYSGLQLIVTKCCHRTTVSYE